MGPDWLDFLLPTLTVIGMGYMGYGAYQGIRAMRENGTWSGAAYALTVAVQLVYLCGGMLIVLSMA